MSQAPGSSAATRTTTKKANGIGRRLTTRSAGTRARVGARLELVGKYDVLNMSDSGFNDAGGCRTTRLYPNLASSRPAPYRASSLGLCGEQKTWIIGVNWYLNDYVRLMFDYAEADLSGYPLTNVTAGTSLALTHLPRLPALMEGRSEASPHAPRSTGKTTKLEKRNFSPLRCQTAAPKRGGGFFAPPRLPARCEIVAKRPQVLPKKPSVARLSQARHCVRNRTVRPPERESGHERAQKRGTVEFRFRATT